MLKGRLGSTGTHGGYLCAVAVSGIFQYSFNVIHLQTLHCVEVQMKS